MAKKKAAEKQRSNRSFHRELISQMLSLATSGLGLAAALAWNETIQQFVKEFVEPSIPGSGLVSKFIYALLVTSFAVFITYQLSRLAAHFQQRKK